MCASHGWERWGDHAELLTRLSGEQQLVVVLCDVAELVCAPDMASAIHYGDVQECAPLYCNAHQISCFEVDHWGDQVQLGQSKSLHFSPAHAAGLTSGVGHGL